MLETSAHGAPRDAGMPRDVSRAVMEPAESATPGVAMNGRALAAAGQGACAVNPAQRSCGGRGLDAAVAPADDDAGISAPRQDCARACDPLTACHVQGTKSVCGACPDGFAGTGETGCAPQLSTLQVMAGQLVPEFNREIRTYRLQVPLVTQRLQVKATAPQGVEVSIQQQPVSQADSVTLPLLAPGDTTVPITLRTRAGVVNEYQITVSRNAQSTYVKAGNAGAGDTFGTTVAAYADTVVVGSPYESGATASETDRQRVQAAGAAYVFARDGDQWREQAYLKSNQISANELFGASVSIWGDRIAVGALGQDIFTALGTGTRDGAVLVFVKQGGQWMLESRVVSANAQNSGDGFGFAVVLREDGLLVGAPLEDDGGVRSGAAYFFTREGSRWQQRQRFKAPAPQAESRFGSSLAYDGVTIAIGACQEETNGSARAGGVYTYTGAGASWSLLQRVAAPTVRPMAQFGYALAVQDDLLIASAPHNALEAMSRRSGEVHVLQRRQTGYVPIAVLSATAPAIGDYFGNSLALRDTALIIGATGEYSAAASNESRSMPGAAYLFGRTDQGFARMADLTAMPGDAQDAYGYGVAITDSFVVVSAQKEDGLAGDPMSNAVKDSGAIYVVR